ncbi:MAG: hypothetical protein HY606_08205 [Planctomycetes bacterium]|nr:hypothetical protein [Planctomycetota bacterium]
MRLAIRLVSLILIAVVTSQVSAQQVTTPSVWSAGASFGVNPDGSMDVYPTIENGFYTYNGRITIPAEHVPCTDESQITITTSFINLICSTIVYIRIYCPTGCIELHLILDWCKGRFFVCVFKSVPGGLVALYIEDILLSEYPNEPKSRDCPIIGGSGELC